MRTLLPREVRMCPKNRIMGDVRVTRGPFHSTPLAARPQVADENAHVVSRPNFDRRAAGDVPRRPSPLKIEAADPAVAIQNFPDQIQTGYDPGFHRSVIDFFQ